MRIHLLIGPTGLSTARFRTILKRKRMLLEKYKVVSPEWNHIRIYMACADPDQVGLVRYLRGFADADAQVALYKHLHVQLAQTLERTPADDIVLSSGQLGALMTRPSELERLRQFLRQFSDDIRITAFVGEQTQLLQLLYEENVMDGRARPLTQELALTQADSWWDSALALYQDNQPDLGFFNHIQCPPQWLDYARLADLWQGVFGEGSLTLRPLEMAELNAETAPALLNDLLDLEAPLGTVDPAPPIGRHSAVTLARARQYNDVLHRYAQAKQICIPHKLWSGMLYELRKRGPVMNPGALYPIADYFKPLNEQLRAQHTLLTETCFVPPKPVGDGQLAEVDPEDGFRASQYLTAAAFRLDRQSQSLADKQAIDGQAAKIGEKLEKVLPDDEDASEGAKKSEFIEMLKVNHRIVLSTHIRPHNEIGRGGEDDAMPPYAVMPPRTLPAGRSGNVIVGCMKNEAPYIVEWVAYHRAIGIDNFLIYTNGCEDGTSELLDHLQSMGVLQHRLNDNWKGNSPQQHALNRSQEEPLIQNADWIIHIDVDEFMNIRVGNGTLEDLFAKAPNATNFAMTWRLFGHNGVTKLSDDLVIEQFDHCAPKYCPKPHTVWGFKTMFRNIGAYKRFSCHRPNQLRTELETQVKWVNGSGQDITEATLKNGWRSSKKTIGYDLIQLNHYALRSAESFLIKRQRGRALHVDRSIGLNYWIRMDWSDHKDVTIKRNIPRVRAEYDRLMADPTLRDWHEKGLAWHRAKADELHTMPEFKELYDQAINVKLSETERVAYALALDMES